VSISTVDGYSPGYQPRVADTSNITALSGSPSPLYSNDTRVGNVLIIQSDSALRPTAKADGGEIVFVFTRPTEIIDVTLFNVAQGSIIIVDRPMTGYTDTRSIPVGEFPADLVLTTDVDLKEASKFTVQFAGVGAIASVGIFH